MNSNLKIIIALTFVVLIIYLCVFYFINSKKPFYKKLVDKPIFLVENYNEEIDRFNIPKSEEGQKYTYSFWIRFVNMGSSGTWRNYDAPKGILSHFNAPNIHYIPKDHILRITVGYKGNTEMIEKYNFNIDNLKIQKWQHIAVTLDGKNTSIFVNGELEKSINLPNTPFISEKSLYIGQKNNNFNGYLALLEYWNDCLNIDQIRQIYQKNNGSLSNKLITYNDFYLNKN